MLPDAELSNPALKLLHTSEAYLVLGYSVIPLLGVGEQPKAPAVAWSTYQKRRAELGELGKWFVRDEHKALGIVCGSISGIIVLDFDDGNTFNTFTGRHPELAKTYTVKTRRGWHLYYRLPLHQRLPSRSAPGLDLLAEGKYVVAPPSTIDGFLYQTERGGMPRQLDNREMQAIWSFVQSRSEKPSKTAYLPLETARRALTPEQAVAGEIEAYGGVSGAIPEQVSERDLLRLYKVITADRGRNVALFQTAIFARDHGWSSNDVEQLLVEKHARQRRPRSHRPETQAQRRREAVRTIRSAFSRPPRRLKPKHVMGYSNSVREKLLGLHLTPVVRVLEAARLIGMAAGDTFTAAQLVERLRGIVGRDSVHAALKALLPDGATAFSRSNAPPPKSFAATHPQRQDTKNACVREKKSGKSPNHRPARIYILPSNADLCTRLGVRPTDSDSLNRDDLRASRRLRVALHRALIARRPGMYSRRYLASRLGVTVRTLQTYHRDAGVKVQPMYLEQVVGWHNLDTLLVTDRADVPAGRLFLADERGKRYPPLRPLAMRLLGQGRALKLVRQDVNYYFVGDRLPMQVALGIHPRQEALDEQVKAEEAWRRCYRQQRAMERIAALRGEPPPPAPKSPQRRAASTGQGGKRTTDSTPKKGRKRHYHRRFRDARKEALAIRIYVTVNKVTATPEHRLSLPNARRWVDIYEAGVIQMALELVGRRNNIDKPAGFVASVLRSSSRSGSIGYAQ